MALQGLRKRRRSGDYEGIDTTTGDLVVDGHIIRDENYYLTNGDFFDLVGRVMFKVHRFLLERDASAFSNMFNVAQGHNIDNSQINTEDYPLVLFDDVDDFRGLCWILYALPEVCIQQDKIATANLEKIVALYLITQKYHFETFAPFARDLLYRHCTSIEAHPSLYQISYFKTCPQSRLQSLLRIASMEDEASKEGSFSIMLQSIWMSRLKETMETTSFAFDVAEALNLRNFLAQLYYLHLTWMQPERIQGSTAYAHANIDLEPHRKSTLYHGYWSLHCYWSETQRTALEKRFTCPNLVASRHACGQIWKQLWDSMAKHGGPANFDPLHRLKDMEVILALPEGKDRQNTYECAAEALDAILDALTESLPDHFLGPAV